MSEAPITRWMMSHANHDPSAATSPSSPVMMARIIAILTSGLIFFCLVFGFSSGGLTGFSGSLVGVSSSMSPTLRVLLGHSTQGVE